MAAGVPVPFSKVGFSTREELLTSDLNRLQKLRSRELQDLIADEARTDESRSGSDPQNGRGSRANAASLLPLLSSAAAFTMDLSLGQAFLQDNTISTDITTGGDDSQYQVVRWAAQNVPFTTPAAGNPRIDLVVATPALVDADSASRNVLVNTVTRALAALNVFKTNNPLAAVTVVAGTPDPQPVAPALPAGALALFEVYVPAAAADSTTFKVSRRIQRRGAVAVGATMHGILRGGLLAWEEGVDETATASNIFIGNTTEPSRVVIDGEVLTFASLSSFSPSTLLGVVADAGAASPYAAAAPATSDKVYYLYLCGGRNLPQGSRSSASGNPLQPVILVESLTPPDRNGRPTVAVTTPRGTTIEGALYVGVGYVVMNSTRRKACAVIDDWVYAISGAQGVFNDNVNRSGTLSGSARSSHTLNTRPSLSTAAIVSALAVNTGGGQSPAYFYMGRALGASSVVADGQVLATVDVAFFPQRVDFVTRPSSSGIVFAGPVVNLASFGSFRFQARAWNLNVTRYSSS